MELISFVGSAFFNIPLSIYLIFNPKISFGIEVALSIGISHIFIQLLKLLINRKRPYQKNSFVKHRKFLKDYSFPSGHTTASFALIFSLFFHLDYNILIMYPFLVAISRIYLGLHYPSDVLAGGLIGVFFSYTIHYLFFV